MEDAPSYGTTRRKRSDVTYGQIERAATEILKTGVRPTVGGLRKALGGGSPRTLLDGLNRYWRDLGNQVAGTPDTLRRLPAAVADLAEGLWQRALATAVEAAQSTHADVDGQLSRLKSQLELRQHTLSQREIELDELLRSRERTVKELEEHLRAALSMLTKRDTTITSFESRLAAAQQETAGYRERLAKVLQRAVTRQRRTETRLVAKPKKPVRAPKASRTRKPTRKRPGKHRRHGIRGS
jgi:Plasmid replication region DNA-binding N-term